jgi:hypothetical protein
MKDVGIVRLIIRHLGYKFFEGSDPQIHLKQRCPVHHIPIWEAPPLGEDYTRMPYYQPHNSPTSNLSSKWVWMATLANGFWAPATCAVNQTDVAEKCRQYWMSVHWPHMTCSIPSALEISFETCAGMCAHLTMRPRWRWHMLMGLGMARKLTMRARQKSSSPFCAARR